MRLVQITSCDVHQNAKHFCLQITDVNRGFFASVRSIKNTKKSASIFTTELIPESNGFYFNYENKLQTTQNCSNCRVVPNALCDGTDQGSIIPNFTENGRVTIQKYKLGQNVWQDILLAGFSSCC